MSRFEGRRSQAYDDATGQTITDEASVQGFPTIGIGHLLTERELSSGTIQIGGEQVNWRQGLTDEQINQLAEQDMRKAADIVDKHVDVDLTNAQRDALVSFAFNIGEGNFRRAGAIKALNRGDTEDFLKRHAKWVKSKGRTLPGLVARRGEEATLFRSG